MTKYELEIDTQEEVPVCEHNNGAHKFCPECGLPFAKVSLLEKIKSEILDGFPAAQFEEKTKWYEHATDIKSFSKKYPKVVFELRGEGEESGDIWIKYFKNGKMQVAKAQITFAPFDPKKLD